MAGSTYRSNGDRRRLIRVAVVEENDIFRRGILACLERDDAIEVVFEGRTGTVPLIADVAIASDAAAAEIGAGRPTLVCSDAARPGDLRDGRDHPPGSVVAVLPRSQLTEDQLGAAVRAAASGLRVDVSLDPPANLPAGLPERSLQVLRLLASGYGTRQISDTVGCSERTVKYAIREIERHFDARSRAQVVAEAIRQGII